jgi:hypothetical protein
MQFNRSLLVHVPLARWGVRFVVRCVSAMAALMASPAPSGSSSEASPINAAVVGVGATPSSSRKRKARAWPAEKELLEQLECCICCTPMTGAIYQCMDGHLICAACKPNSASCADPFTSQHSRFVRIHPDALVRFALTVVVAAVLNLCSAEQLRNVPTAPRQHPQPSSGEARGLSQSPLQILGRRLQRVLVWTGS